MLDAEASPNDLSYENGDASMDEKHFGNQILHAIENNSVQEIKDFHEHNYDFNKPIVKPDETSVIPLSYACCIGSVDIVQYLLQIGVDTNIPSTDGKLPMHFACDADEREESRKREYLHIMQLLLQHNCEMNVMDNMGRTPLFMACEADDVDTVRLLVQHGCDVNLQTVCGESPLRVSCRNAKYWSYWHGRERIRSTDFPPVKITKILLKANADISEATLLPMAVQLGDTTLVEELLDLGMDINMLDDNMCTPLGTACSSTHVRPQMIKLLLDRGADVNKGGGWKKQKPLIFAYVHNSVEKIKLLLSYGAEITPAEMSELVSITLSKSILENPEVVGPKSKELESWRLLIAHGFAPVVRNTELYYKIHQLSMCSSYDKISPWIQQFLYPVHSLQDLCRISIRRNMHISIDSNIDALPIPPKLKDFLKVKELV